MLMLLSTLDIVPPPLVCEVPGILLYQFLVLSLYREQLAWKPGADGAYL